MKAGAPARAPSRACPRWRGRLPLVAACAACATPAPEFVGDRQVVVGQEVTLTVLRGDGFGDTPDFRLEDARGASFSAGDAAVQAAGSTLTFLVPSGIAAGVATVVAGPYTLDLDVMRLAVGVGAGGAVAVRAASGAAYADAAVDIEPLRARTGVPAALLAIASETGVVVLDLGHDPPAPATGRIDFADPVRDAVVVGQRLCVALARGLCVVRLAASPSVEGCAGGDMRAVAPGADGASCYGAGAVECDAGAGGCDGIVRVNVGQPPVAAVATWTLDETGGGVADLAVGDAYAIVLDDEEAALRAADLGSTDVASLPLPDDLPATFAAAGGGRMAVGGGARVAEVIIGEDGAPALGATIEAPGDLVGLGATAAGEFYAGLADGFASVDLDGASAGRAGEWAGAATFAVQP